MLDEASGTSPSKKMPSFGDMARIVSKRWKSIGEAEKAKLVALAEIEKRRYYQEIDVWYKFNFERVDEDSSSTTTDASVDNAPKSPELSYQKQEPRYDTLSQGLHDSVVSMDSNVAISQDESGTFNTTASMGGGNAANSQAMVSGSLAPPQNTVSPIANSWGDSSTQRPSDPIHISPFTSNWGSTSADESFILNNNNSNNNPPMGDSGSNASLIGQTDHTFPGVNQQPQQQSQNDEENLFPMNRTCNNIEEDFMTQLLAMSLGLLTPDQIGKQKDDGNYDSAGKTDLDVADQTLLLQDIIDTTVQGTQTADGQNNVATPTAAATTPLHRTMTTTPPPVVQGIQTADVAAPTAAATATGYTTPLQRATTTTTTPPPTPPPTPINSDNSRHNRGGISIATSTRNDSMVVRRGYEEDTARIRLLASRLGPEAVDDVISTFGSSR